MAQYRQSGIERYGSRGGSDQHHHHDFANGAASSDHVAVGIRASGNIGKPARWRRSGRQDKSRRFVIGSVVSLLFLLLFVTILAYCYISGYSLKGSDDKAFNKFHREDDDPKSYSYFLTNVTRTDPSKILRFGHDSVAHGRDSRYWDKDDRRRDDDYNEDAVEHKQLGSEDNSLLEGTVKSKEKNNKNGVVLDNSAKSSDLRGVTFYNEAGRNELKKYEEEYQASFKKGSESRDTNENEENHEPFDADDDDNDAIDSRDFGADEYIDSVPDEEDNDKPHKEKSSNSFHAVPKNQKLIKGNEEAAANRLLEVSSLSDAGSKSTKSSRSDTRRRSRRHKFSGASCEMKLYNSTAQLLEPLETRKFARFSLQYIKREEKPDGDKQWLPRFAGHQSLLEREDSFVVRDKRIHCGFVEGPIGLPSTGFDLKEDDINYISRCHIAVISCIFGNSDRLRSPAVKMVSDLLRKLRHGLLVAHAFTRYKVSRFSRKNVCFVMFVDEITLEKLTSEGHMPDRGGFVGLWKLVVVKNLPYSDMRRVGKIPKLLPHRLFPSARYSIWLDSKLRLQMDPLLILEYFLWRKGYEYAISNHYDRHCVWEEVAQNKKLNKYNHTVIDQQFKFYRSDGLTRFNASDPNKLLRSNVPEGSLIVRAHTPMSNLFSCLWFNEVDRFTSRDQLSFAYTYQKLRKMNPERPLHLHMFKDCERRKIAKLFHHRSQ